LDRVDIKELSPAEVTRLLNEVLAEDDPEDAFFQDIIDAVPAPIGGRNELVPAPGLGQPPDEGDFEDFDEGDSEAEDEAEIIAQDLAIANDRAIAVAQMDSRDNDDNRDDEKLGRLPVLRNVVYRDMNPTAVTKFFQVIKNRVLADFPGANVPHQRLDEYRIVRDVDRTPITVRHAKELMATGHFHLDVDIDGPALFSA
jgi:hypothetical protein